MCFVKKQKQRSFLFLFDVSKYKKKSQDSYTNYLKRPCKAIQCVQRLFLPFSSVALYNGMTHRKLDGMYLAGKCHVYKKYVQDSFYFVCNSIHSNYFCVLFRKHTELKILAARFYSTTPQISTDDSLSTANSAGLR